MKHTKRRLAIIATSTAAVLIGGGVAVAYWTSSGSGTGSAAVGNTAGLTVSTATTASAIYPGASVPISFTVTNPDVNNNVVVNDVTVTVTGVTQAVGATGACSAADFTVSHTAGAPVTVGKNGGTAAATAFGTGYQLVFANTGVNQDGCKGATVNLATQTN